MLHSWTQDLRYAAHLLRRNPVFALTAILSLAIGIGANTTIFTIANVGTQAAVGVTFEQVPPAGATVSLANNPGWSVGSNGQYFFTIGNLAVGAAVKVSFNVTVPTTAKLNSTFVDALYVLDSIGLESSTSLKTTIVKNGRRS